MKIVFIVRSTLFTVKGGDTIQVQETAANLRYAGVEVEIKKASEKINYTEYDLLHFFNITRPADMLLHINRSNKPFVVSTILINYSIYDKQYRKGLTGKMLRAFSAQGVEYAKTLYRFLSGNDKLVSTSYIWKGQHRSIKEVLSKTKAVLVQAKAEYDDLLRTYGIATDHHTIYNGINKDLFKDNLFIKKKKDLVLCVARIEGIKNQYNLIRALNNSSYRLIIIGDAAPNQKEYYEQCKSIAAANVSFLNYLPQQELVRYYAEANVHVLPSWFEVCGLSSLEAAAMGCQLVITDNGYARSYFEDAVFYCDPSKPESILRAVEHAMNVSHDNALQKKVIQNYSWKKTAEDTLAVYKKYIS